MLTSPITTDLFHSRVLALLSSTQTTNSQSDGDTGRYQLENPSRLVVPPLSPVDTNLTPQESMNHVIAVTSSWTDLCSPDPLVADVSKQVLMLEIAYAAFCGISYVLIPGPKLHQQAMKQAGLMQYARAIQEVLAIGSYMQINIWLPMIDHQENEVVRMGDLAPLARPEYLGLGDEPEGQFSGLDLYGTWDAWNVIRSFCRYHTRLCIGKKTFYGTSLFSFSKTCRKSQVACCLSCRTRWADRFCRIDTPETSAASRYSDKMVLRADQAAYD